MGIVTRRRVPGRLGRPGDLSRTGICGHGGRLPRALPRSYAGDDTIKLNIEVGDILHGIDLAIPRGLIIPGRTARGGNIGLSGDNGDSGAVFTIKFTDRKGQRKHQWSTRGYWS